MLLNKCASADSYASYYVNGFVKGVLPYYLTIALATGFLHLIPEVSLVHNYPRALQAFGLGFPILDYSTYYKNIFETLLSTQKNVFATLSPFGGFATLFVLFPCYYKIEKNLFTYIKILGLQFFGAGVILLYYFCSMPVKVTCLIVCGAEAILGSILYKYVSTVADTAATTGAISVFKTYEQTRFQRFVKDLTESRWQPLICGTAGLAILILATPISSNLRHWKEMVTIICASIMVVLGRDSLLVDNALTRLIAPASLSIYLFSSVTWLMLKTVVLPPGTAIALTLIAALVAVLFTCGLKSLEAKMVMYPMSLATIVVIILTVLSISYLKTRVEHIVLENPQFVLYKKGLCQNGFTDINGLCYSVFEHPTKPMSLGQVQEYCRNVDAKLATGATHEERCAMLDLISSAPKNRAQFDTLLGLTKSPSQRWTTVDGIAPAVENLDMCDGKPNWTSSQRACAVASFKKGKFCFSPKPCNSPGSARFLCVKRRHVCFEGVPYRQEGRVVCQIEPKLKESGI